jgi:chromosome segregation ATPase
MAEAQVTSVEAIEAFRVRLIVYLNKARGTLEEGPAEVFRLHQWIQGEQRRNWEDQIRRRRRALEQAENELSSARLSILHQASSAQAMRVRKAREALQEAEAKLSTLKKWDRELDNLSEPLLRQVNPLQHALMNDLPKGLAYLEQVVKTLDAYAGIRLQRPAAATPTESAAESSEPAAGETGGTP